MAGWRIDHAESSHAHAFGDQRVAQPRPVAADAAEVFDRSIGAGRGNGLIKSLASGKDLVGDAGNGLARAGDIGDPVDVVDAQRP